MGLYASTHAEVKTLHGLHLYHVALSNCSQRVRIALEEKGLPWTSHHLNLAANEHATPEYRTINPNGVVPTLVHDGAASTSSRMKRSSMTSSMSSTASWPTTRLPVEVVGGRGRTSQISASGPSF